jgi:hypothetical protein
VNTPQDDHKTPFDDPPEPDGRRAAFLRAILIACIPVVPAAIGGVIWITALGGTVATNVGRIAGLDMRLTEIDMHGSRVTQLLETRIRAIEMGTVEQDRRLTAIENAHASLNARLVVIEERQKVAYDASRSNGDKLDRLNGLILDHLQRQPPGTFRTQSDHSVPVPLPPSKGAQK